jgi:hypothetical protein
MLKNKRSTQEGLLNVQSTDEKEEIPLGFLSEENAPKNL